MNLLPIVDRELRTRARSPATFRARMVGAVVAAVVLTGMVLRFNRMTTPVVTVGRDVFTYLAALGLLGCLFGGAQSTADCLSEEKREGTLGLLFLTDLRGYDVVTGKLAALSLNALYGLVAVFPVMAIAITLGGVTRGEFWRMALVLVSSLFLALCLGLWVSVRSVDGHRASRGALALMAALAALPPLTDQLLHGNALPMDGCLYSVASPVFTCAMAFTGNYTASPVHFWFSEAALLLTGLLLFLSSTLGVTTHWQDEPARFGALDRGRHRLRILWYRLRHSSGELRHWLETHPFVWLALWRQRWELTLMLFATLAVGGACWQMRHPALPAVSYAVVETFAFICAYGLRLMMAARAAQPLVEARRNGTLEVILCSPVTSANIVRGVQLALRRSLFPFLIVNIFVGWFALECELKFFALNPIPISFQGTLMFNGLGQVAVYLTDLIALGWVGMWFALSGRPQNQVISRTFLGVIVLPSLITFIGGLRGITIVSLAGIDWRFPSFWPVLMVIKNLLFVAWARRKLATSFRAAAAGVHDQPAAHEPLPRSMEEKIKPLVVRV